MQRSSRKAWLVLSAVWAGCSFVTDFDRDKIPAIDPALDAGMHVEGGVSDGESADARAGSDASRSNDAAGQPDSALAVGCGGNDDCGADQLCCDSVCVNTSVASRCSSCTQGCDPNVANTCKSRACGCDDGSVCSGGRPFCTSEGGSGCAECRTGVNDCVGRTDGKAQCVKGSCVVCDPTNNAGCGGTTPICDAATLTCVKCSMAPNNCSGSTVCIASGACGGCDDATDCATPTTPICDLALTVCHSCAADQECATQLSRAYCVNDGRCGVCKPVASAADPGCDIASATPACRLNASSQYQCQACSENSQCGGAASSGVRATCSNGHCVECANDAGCTDAAKPFCGSDGLCKSCANANAAFCLLNTFGIRPLCDSTSGRCVACRDSTDCSGTTPICNPTTHVCRACAADGDCGGATPACNLTTGACTVCRAGGASACTTEPNTTCSANHTCIDCDANGGCAAGDQCKTASGMPNQCVDCINEGGCTGSNHCNTSTNACVRCTTSQHCADGDMCTQDRCDANACSNPPLAAIDDGIGCTDDACVMGTGAISHTPNNAKCVAVDAFSCTVPSCEPSMTSASTGCVEQPNNQLCNDAVACTSDACVGAGGDGNGCKFSSTCTQPAVCDVPSGTCM